MSLNKLYLNAVIILGLLYSNQIFSAMDSIENLPKSQSELDEEMRARESFERIMKCISKNSNPEAKDILVIKEWNERRPARERLDRLRTSLVNDNGIDPLGLYNAFHNTNNHESPLNITRNTNSHRVEYLRSILREKKEKENKNNN